MECHSLCEIDLSFAMMNFLGQFYSETIGLAPFSSMFSTLFDISDALLFVVVKQIYLLITY